MSDEYKIGHFSDADVNDFIQLHMEVFDAWKGSEVRDQFEWKYIKNPFLDYVPILTAKAGNQLVGARGMVAHQMRINQDNILALQGADAMVHPDHRRKGVYSRIYEFFLSEYEKRKPRIFFGFPNENALPAHLKFGCKGLELEKYRRSSPTIINTPNRTSDLSEIKSTVLKTIHGLTVSSLKLLNKLGKTLRTRQGHVQKFNNPPINALVNIYKESEIKGIHSKRSSDFYKWRLNEPMEDFTTYISFDRSGGPLCAIITSEQLNRIIIREMLLNSGESKDTLRYLMANVIKDKGHQYEYSVLTGRQVQLLKNGFLPASYTSTSSGNQSFVVKSLESGRGDIINGVDITKSGNWDVSFIDKDN